jgi:general secretion pathway protein B
MSYILDALKKSEQERKLQAVPALHTLRRTRSGTRRLRLAVAMFAAVSVAAAAVVWLVEPRWPSPAATTQQPLASSGAVEAPPKPPAAPRESGQPAEAPPDGVRSGRTTSGPEPAVPGRLEGLAVNVVSYSEKPGRRFVMLNQRIVRESDTIGDGVVVKRILPEGVVLSVDGDEVLLKP